MNDQDKIPVVQIQIQDNNDQQEADSQTKLNKRKTTRSSTYFPIEQIAKIGSQDILQTTSKTYFRLKNNIIQDDSAALKSKTIPQPKCSASVPHIHSQSSSLIDRSELNQKNPSSYSVPDNDSKSDKGNGDDDDSKLFSQIHLRDRKGRRSTRYSQRNQSNQQLTFLLIFRQGMFL